jgi:hypothetical protein
MSSQSHRNIRKCGILLLAAALAACSGDIVAPDSALRAPSTPHALLASGEFSRTITDTTDAAGNHVMVTEYAAGIYTQPDGVSGSIGSVTIKTVIPATGDVSGSCITSTVVSTETTPGWTATVKKPGGCDKEIVVLFENAATGQKATFRYLYIFGKTRIDAGAVS